MPVDDSRFVYVGDPNYFSPVELELREQIRRKDRLIESLLREQQYFSGEKQQAEEFRTYYLRIVGPAYVDLDDVNATVAEERARSNPGIKRLHEAAVAARQQADASAAEVAEVPLLPDPEQLTKSAPPVLNPPDSLKTLYRKLVRMVHPDLASSESERTVRTEFLARATTAYERQDERALKNLLDDWVERIDSGKEKTDAQQLRQVSRTVQRLTGKVEDVQRERIFFENTDTYVLYRKFVVAVFDRLLKDASYREKYLRAVPHTIDRIADLGLIAPRDGDIYVPNYLEWDGNAYLSKNYLDAVRRLDQLGMNGENYVTQDGYYAAMFDYLNALADPIRRQVVNAVETLTRL
jgi:hypothetical protein